MRAINFGEKLERVIAAGISPELFGNAVLCGSIEAVRRLPSQYVSRASSSEYLSNEAKRVVYEIETVVRKVRGNSQYEFTDNEIGVLNQLTTPSRIYCSLDAGLLLLDADVDATHPINDVLPSVATKIGESFLGAIPALKTLSGRDSLPIAYRVCVSRLQEYVAAYVNNSAIKGLGQKSV